MSSAPVQAVLRAGPSLPKDPLPPIHSNCYRRKFFSARVARLTPPFVDGGGVVSTREYVHGLNQLFVKASS